MYKEGLEQAGAEQLLALLRGQGSDNIVRPCKRLPFHEGGTALLVPLSHHSLPYFSNWKLTYGTSVTRDEGFVSFSPLLPPVSCYFQDIREYIDLSIKTTTKLVARLC